jgi:hypothetical protein
MSKKKKQEFVAIIVLNDGQTYSEMSGCSIRIIPIEHYEEVCDNGGDAADFESLVEIGL